MVLLLVLFTHSVGPDSAPELLEVRGDWDESFRSSLTRSAGSTPGNWQVYLPGRDGLPTKWKVVDEAATVRQVAAATDGYTFPVDKSGRGGGVPGALSETGASDLVPLVKYVSPAVAAAQAYLYRNERAMARDWMDSGDREVPMPLTQAVSREREWLRNIYDTMFGLDADPGGRLLRAVGYRKVSRTPDTWVDERE